MSATDFSTLSDRLEDLLDSDLRAGLAGEAAARRSLADALSPVRQMMRGHVWTLGARVIPLTSTVHALDARTRTEGFHALHDWDGVADHVNPEIIPVDVLDFVHRIAGRTPSSANPVAVALDYYFFHVLSLLALRIWDTGDPGGALTRIDGLLAHLQGPRGSGQPFVHHAETLLLIATSHFEPAEHGYGLLLDRMPSLPADVRTRIAREHAASLGAHLRFGFLATYARDTQAMRQDNVADYPWLVWAVRTLLETLQPLDDDQWAAPGSTALVEALLGGLTADTDVLVNHAGIAEALGALGQRLSPRFEALRPGRSSYSPLSLCFNFSHNLIKGTVVDAMLRGDPWTVSYSDLLCGPAAGASPLRSREALARTLMDYARRSPQRIRGELLPVIVYDPDAGLSAYEATMARLAQVLNGAT